MAHALLRAHSCARREFKPPSSGTSAGAARKSASQECVRHVSSHESSRVDNNRRSWPRLLCPLDERGQWQSHEAGYPNVKSGKQSNDSAARHVALVARQLTPDNRERGASDRSRQGLRNTASSKPRTHTGFAYQATTAAKMPDQPTARALRPNMTSFGPWLFLNSSAGRQQAIANNTMLTSRPLFMYPRILSQCAERKPCLRGCLATRA